MRTTITRIEVITITAERRGTVIRMASSIRRSFVLVPASVPSH